MGDWVVTIIVAVIGAASTLGGIAWTRRGNREVKELSVEEGAYTRASEIDKGVHERVVQERDYFSDQLDKEREGRQQDRERHARERAELREEIVALEQRVQAMLDELVSLRQRHDGDGYEDGFPSRRKP